MWLRSAVKSLCFGLIAVAFFYLLVIIDSLTFHFFSYPSLNTITIITVPIFFAIGFIATLIHDRKNNQQNIISAPNEADTAIEGQLTRKGRLLFFFLMFSPLSFLILGSVAFWFLYPSGREVGFGAFLFLLLYLALAVLFIISTFITYTVKYGFNQIYRPMSIVLGIHFFLIFLFFTVA